MTPSFRIGLRRLCDEPMAAALREIEGQGPRSALNRMVVLNKIYTRTGDDGTTALGTGARVRKDAVRVAAYGTVDETNAAIGLGKAISASMANCRASRTICLTLERICVFRIEGRRCLTSRCGSQPRR